MELPTFLVLGTFQAPSETWAEKHKQAGPCSRSDPEQRALKWPLEVQRGLGG